MRLTASILGGVATAALLLASAPALAAAPIMNGGFEENLDDWTADDAFVSITNVFYHRDENGDAVLPPYGAREGYFFAVLTGGDEYTAPDYPLVTLTQSFSISERGLFRGLAAFSSGDYAPYNDFAYIKVTGVSGSYTVFSTDVLTVGDYGRTPWRGFGKVLEAGDYTIEAGIANVGDNMQTSFLLLDDFRVTAVPEPATWALMLSGFFGLGAVLRRRRAVVA